MKVLITTHPFNKENLIKDNINHYHFNEAYRKYTPIELRQQLRKHQPDIIIAGTDNFDKKTLSICKNLKLISRVGIGLDSVDLKYCKNNHIIVTYTPDAPSNAVAELSICQMLNLLRKVPTINKTWNRFIGRDIKYCNIGIIGCGRIGTLVTEKLKGLNPKNIFINDIDKSIEHKLKVYKKYISLNKTEILKQSDIITIHIPLNKNNFNYISKKEFKLLKEDCRLINTSRGGIVNENALYNWLVKNKNGSAAVDVFCNEPYKGKLIDLDNCYLTPHMGSCTKNARYKMENGAYEEVMNYIHNKEFNNRVV